MDPKNENDKQSIPNFNIRHWEKRLTKIKAINIQKLQENVFSYIIVAFYGTLSYPTEFFRQLISLNPKFGVYALIKPDNFFSKKKLGTIMLVWEDKIKICDEIPIILGNFKIYTFKSEVENKIWFDLNFLITFIQCLKKFPFQVPKPLILEIIKKIDDLMVIPKDFEGYTFPKEDK
eukprot:TRINITY_DN3353_c0_g1_i2.p1 TRINITY_DN3353_c0_g1~~TRINITY_DN3353_c0_g1_i2.p1  ORF type:complete len:176 (-),score=37.29 TRINITY_DN3353_c0_g1_i2:9-536(-)